MDEHAVTNAGELILYLFGFEGKRGECVGCDVGVQKATEASKPERSQADFAETLREPLDDIAVVLDRAEYHHLAVTFGADLPGEFQLQSDFPHPLAEDRDQREDLGTIEIAKDFLAVTNDLLGAIGGIEETVQIELITLGKGGGDLIEVKVDEAAGLLG
jgi:hypothetical protein